MKILIDISSLASSRTGIGNYVFHLTEALLRGDPANRYCLFGPEVRRDPFPQYPKELRIRAWLCNVVALDHLARKGWVPRLPADVDVYHHPYPGLPFRTAPKTRLVVTVHDLTFLLFPDFVADREYFRYLVRAVSEQVARADHIVTDSHSTAADVVRVFGTPPEKVSAVHLGFDRACFHPRPEPPDAALADAIPQQFFLSVGTIEPRKNHLSLLRAFEQFVRRTGDTETHLVLAGGLGWRYEPVCAYIERSEQRRRIVHLSGLSSAAIASLYRRAVLTAYPSFYEGFGLPVLEAMACGSPVVASNASSLPEVAGDAGVLVDPRDVAALTEALVRVSSDEGLRLQMREAGLRQADRFSWEAAARETLAAYGKAVAAR
ncbi:MAG: glycosyltransferase family 4 protein [Armatimonadetes bacterium]|nr:glycosyltransferase family 4 protein [Armatimonadota bacterium]